MKASEYVDSLCRAACRREDRQRTASRSGRVFRSAVKQSAPELGRVPSGDNNLQRHRGASVCSDAAVDRVMGEDSREETDWRRFCLTSGNEEIKG
jgi:hypothetical protein